MTFLKSLLAGGATLALTATGALAEPALIFDRGGKFDKSFNEAAYTGAQRWAVDVVLEARMELAVRGAVFLRGDTGPFAPYLPSGAYL